MLFLWPASVLSALPGMSRARDLVGIEVSRLGGPGTREGRNHHVRSGDQTETTFGEVSRPRSARSPDRAMAGSGRLVRRPDGNHVRRGLPTEPWRAAGVRSGDQTETTFGEVSRPSHGGQRASGQETRREPLRIAAHASRITHYAPHQFMSSSSAIRSKTGAVRRPRANLAHLVSGKFQTKVLKSL